MSEGTNQRWISSHAFVLMTALAFVLLGAPGISAAQSQGAAKAAPAAQKRASADSGDKGLNTGIKVHGHWVIEVKKPDGTVTARREFENALSPGFVYVSTTFGTVTTGSGEAFLSALMTGQVSAPIAWMILLESPATTNSPCANEAYVGTGCFLFQNSPNTPGNFVSSCGGTPAPGLSCNLTVSPLGTSPNFVGFQLSGSVVATGTGTISSVTTMDVGACGANDALASCPFVNNGGVLALTAKNLDGLNGDPAAVSVTSSGQTIAVTVNISFQ